jgi:triphosphoribosyl-dephospho-CoA synthetase
MSNEIIRALTLKAKTSEIDPGVVLCTGHDDKDTKLHFSMNGVYIGWLSAKEVAVAAFSMKLKRHDALLENLYTAGTETETKNPPVEAG